MHASVVSYILQVPSLDACLPHALTLFAVCCHHSGWLWGDQGRHIHTHLHLQPHPGDSRGWGRYNL